MRYLVLNNSTSMQGISLNERGIRIYPFELDWGFILTGYNEDIFSDIIRVKLDAFAAQLGYPHGLTPNDITSYITRSARLFALARYAKSAYDAEKFSDARGIHHPNMSKFYRLPVVSVTNVNFSQSAPASQHELPVMSNHSWNAFIGDVISLARVPAQWLAIISYFHDNWFSNDANNDDGISELFRFQPALVGTASTPNSEALQLIGDMKSDVAHKPLILEFLSVHMNIEPFAADFEWNRDQSGQTLTIVEDVDLIYALETNFNTWFAGIGKDTLIKDKEVVYTPYGIDYSILDAPTVLSLDAESFFYHFIFFDKDDGNVNYSGVLFGYTRFNSLGTTKVTVLPPGAVGGETVAYGTMLEFPLQLPFKPTYYVNENQVQASSSTVKLIASPNVFLVNESDFLSIKRDKFVELYFTVPEAYMTRPVSPVIRTQDIGTVKQDPKPKQNNNNGKNNRKKKKSNK